MPTSDESQTRPSQAEREQARLRRHRWGIARSVAMLAALVVLSIFLARRSAAPEVLSVTPAQALDADYRPVDPVETFAPGDTFYISVELRGYRPGMDLRARWHYEGQVITETPLDTSTAGDGYAGFSLSPQNPPEWPPGQYAVDIVYDDHVLSRAAFRVADD
jgi:hypothetical protein